MVYTIERILQITKNATSQFLLFKALNVSFISLKIASSVAMPFLKPNWFPGLCQTHVQHCGVGLLTFGTDCSITCRRCVIHMGIRRHILFFILPTVIL
jgi:hypothetical protein